MKNAGDLRRRLVASLTQVTTESDAIAKKLGLESESLANARTKLQDALRDINLESR